MSKRKRLRLQKLSKDNLVIIVGILMITSFLLGILFSKITEQKPIRPKEIKKPVLGYISIIVDDWGYGENVKEFIETIDMPVAIAVLPKLPFSKMIAECAAKNHKEVMLHLPMEPNYNTDKYPKDYIIKTSMRPDKVKKIINDALATVPFVQGVNNHMGSKATENKEFMKTVLTYLKEKNFFFVDSYVTEKSVCKEVADNIRIPFIKRDVFIDNVADRNMMEGEFVKLAHLAEKNGHAVGIGHARPLSLQVIKEQMRILKDKGFVFLTVREMIERIKNK